MIEFMKRFFHRCGTFGPEYRDGLVILRMCEECDRVERSVFRRDLELNVRITMWWPVKWRPSMQLSASNMICWAIAGYAAWHFIPKILATL